MTGRVVRLDTPEDVGDHVAGLIADGLADAQRAGRPYLLGCPTGRTPEPVYTAIARRVGAGLDLTGLIVVLMDEYVVPARDGFALVDPAAPYSCVGFAERQMLGPWVAEGAPRPTLWHADPNDPPEYDWRIAAAGGIDLFLLASGASDGHVAFNPRGSDRGSRTRVVDLAESTRVDNMTTFPTFRELADVPQHGLSVGIATLAEESKRAVMIITGADKREAFAKVTAASEYDPDWPATVIAEIADGLIFADAAASARDGQPADPSSSNQGV